MAGRKTVVRLEYNSDVDSLIWDIDELRNRAKRPDLVFVNLSHVMFPRRSFDLPEKLRQVFSEDPTVKPVWDSNDSLCDFDLFKIMPFKRDEVFVSPGKSNPKVVVALTSWTKRINNCREVIESLLDNTLPPDIVFLSLSIEEFPNLYDDLPEDLVRLCMSNHRVKLNWVGGPNTKSMKKVFPILPYLDDDDLIITCDDDFEIPSDFVQIRVKEFQEYDSRFAITSSNKPAWHNRSLFGHRYWAIGPTSIFSKKMLKGYDVVVDDDVVETYNDDVVYALLILSNGFWIQPTKYLSNHSGLGPRKLKCISDGFGMTENKLYDLNIENVVDKFQKSFDGKSSVSFKTRVSEVTAFQNMNLVIFDATTIAGDNGEYFYRKVRSLYPGIKLTFLLSNKSKDWERLRKDGFNLYPIEGELVPKILDDASFILWSKDSCVNHKKMGEHKNKSIFLGHGYTGVISRDDNYIGKCITNFAEYMVSCSNEEAQTLIEYSKGRLTPIITGFPRHDTLLEKTMGIGKHSPKQILVSFHYRDFPTQADFCKSDYLNKITELLNSDELKQICDSGIDVVFKPHSVLISRKWDKLFNLPKYIKQSDKPFQDLLVESDCLVTDFSSNSFEMAYMNKPTYVYVPDEEYVKWNVQKYNIGNISRYGHLKYCKDFQTLIQNIKRFVKGQVNFDFANGLFRYVDTNNSARLMNWLIEKYNTWHSKDVVPRTIWQFWTGDNEITPNRLNCLKSNVNLGVDFKLLQGNDIYKMQVKGHPFHPAFEWLSYTHRADYLRCYFMHFYGGGYADIKEYSKDNNWAQCLDLMNENRNIIGIGQKEIIGGSSIKEYNNMETVSKLIANGYFMFRQNTDFTRKWLAEVEKKLTERFEALKACWPVTSQHPNICNDKKGSNFYFCKDYPFGWAELLCDIVHPLELKCKTGQILPILVSGRTNSQYR